MIRYTANRPIQSGHIDWMHINSNKRVRLYENKFGFVVFCVVFDFPQKSGCIANEHVGHICQYWMN